MSEQEQWQLDGSAPELYERYLVPAITSVWAADLIDRANPKRGETVLDIACGTGAVTRRAADRMKSGRVVGLDFNSGMLGVARSVASAGATIEWCEGSALDLPFESASFDLVLCQLGLQFFSDRPGALAEMKRVLSPAGRIALSVYSSIERTSAAYAFAQALDRHLGPESSKIKRAEHIFDKPDALSGIMIEAGFVDVVVETVVKIIRLPSVIEYVRFQLTATPMASLVSSRSEVERERVVGAVADHAQSLLEPEMLRDGRLSFSQEAYVATALCGA